MSTAQTSTSSDAAKWLAEISSGKWARVENLKELDTILTPKTYLAGPVPTAPDFALYSSLHPVYAKLTPEQYHTYPSVTRYFDHLQSLASVEGASKAQLGLELDFPVIPLSFENAPKAVRVADAPKPKKDKAAPVPPPTAGASIAPAVESKVAEKKDKSAKKGAESTPAAPAVAVEGEVKKKKEKAPKPAAAPAPVAADAGEPVPSMIDLRVGKIVQVAKHPDADGLYVEQIDIGEPTGPRTVVSGLVNYIPIEEMQDRIMITVCNMKPANMRGIKSFAMVLCASSKAGKDGGIEFVEPPPGSKPGDRVYFEGFESGVPVSQLNPKKKIFEAIQPGFITLPTREAAWVDPKTGSVHRIVTKNGVCAPKTLVGASLS